MEYIITQGNNTRLQIWEFPSGKLHYSINHKSVIWSYDISNDNRIIVYNDYYGNIYIYSLILKQKLKEVKTDYFLIQVKITQNVSRILSVVNKVEILNISLYPKFKSLVDKKHDSIITEYQIIELNNIYITCSLDNKMIISDLNNNQILKEINNYQPYVSKIIFNQDKFYTISLDDEIKEWSLKSFKFNKYLYLDLNSILDIKFKNNNTIIYSNNNQEIIQKNLINNEVKSLLIRKYPEQLEICDNNKLIYLDNNGKIYYGGKLIIKSDIIKFNYLKIKNKNLNIFDQKFIDMVEPLLEQKICEVIKDIIIKKI
jgi:hypothetical protein